MRIAIGLDDFDRGLAAYAGDLALEVTHARFASVAAQDHQQSAIGELDILFFKAVGLALLLHQVTLCDVELLDFGVTRDADYFHSVLQRARDAIQRVRRGDEHHLGQIVVAVEVVIVEGVVLLGIEHFEQGRGRVAAEIG